MKDNNKAIFLDRDGVINKEVSHLSDPDKFVFIEGSIKALKIFKDLGYLLIVITNQAGIARGLFNQETLSKIHEKMKRILKENNIIIDDIFYCPHHPDDGFQRHRRRQFCGRARAENAGGAAPHPAHRP